MACAKKVYQLYPDVDKIDRLPVDERQWSMTFFLTERGKQFLTDKLNLIASLEEKPDNTIYEEKFGEDKVVKFKPRTPLEFIKKNYGKS